MVPASTAGSKAMRELAEAVILVRGRRDRRPS